ncbi:MAG TPA: cysteine rich repeat-containing protein [Nitrospirota bacterium]|nr:cysteine rich repeat-containing protein [Nitrospirota bacterium]
MKISITLVVLICMLLVGGIAVAAEQKGITATVQEGCKQELDTYCKEVTPGEGRVLACLYAFQDKLSDRCEYALYDAAARLEKAVNALKYAASQCKHDLNTFCSQVQPGEGRLLQCLDKNSAKVSAKCKQALKDTGLKE